MSEMHLMTSIMLNQMISHTHSIFLQTLPIHDVVAPIMIIFTVIWNQTRHIVLIIDNFVLSSRRSISRERNGDTYSISWEKKIRNPNYMTFSINVEGCFLKFIITNKYTMSGLSITTYITRMTYFTRVVSRSRSMNNVSKLFTTPTTNEDLASSEDNIRHVHPLEEKTNNNTRTLGCLLIDSVDEAKEESDKFTKVIEASS